MFDCNTKMSSTTVYDWTQSSCRGLEITNLIRLVLHLCCKHWNTSNTEINAHKTVHQKLLKFWSCCSSPDVLSDCETSALWDKQAAPAKTQTSTVWNFSFFSQLYPRNCILTITAFLNQLKGYSVIVWHNIYVHLFKLCPSS